MHATTGSLDRIIASYSGIRAADGVAREYERAAGKSAEVLLIRQFRRVMAVDAGNAYTGSGGEWPWIKMEIVQIYIPIGAGERTGVIAVEFSSAGRMAGVAFAVGQVGGEILTPDRGGLPAVTAYVVAGAIYIVDREQC